MNYKVFILIVLVLCSCHGDGMDGIRFDISQVHEEYKRLYEMDMIDLGNSIITEASLLFEVGEMVGNENYTFGNIKSVQIFEGKFYLLDSSAKQIKIFNENGSWVDTYDVRGAGPGELFNPEDMIITDDEIYILDSSGKVIIYGVTDEGIDYKGQYDIYGGAQSLCVINDHLFVMHRLHVNDDYIGGNENIISYSKRDGVIEGAYGDVNITRNWLFNREISRGKVYCHDDTLYYIYWYIPMLFEDINNGKNSTKATWMDNALIENIISTTNEAGRPRVIKEFDANRGALVNLYINDKIKYIQFRNYNDDGGDNYSTYKIKESKIYKINGLGYLHYISNGKAITSKSSPYPHLAIFRMD